MIIGLTGSIAMGKTTAAGMLREYGIPVFDADRSVHDLMNIPNGGAVLRIGKAYPKIIVENDAGEKVIDRKALSNIAAGNDVVMDNLERILHPLVKDGRIEFIEKKYSEGHKIVVLDIPLLFETDGHKEVNKIITMSAPKDVQIERAMERPNMTEEKLKYILSRQMPDELKRQRSDYVVNSNQSFDGMRQDLIDTIEELKLNA